MFIYILCISTYIYQYVNSEWFPDAKKKENKRRIFLKRRKSKQTDFDFVELCKSTMTFHRCFIKQTELYGHDVDVLIICCYILKLCWHSC